MFSSSPSPAHPHPQLVVSRPPLPTSSLPRQTPGTPLCRVGEQYECTLHAVDLTCVLGTRTAHLIPRRVAATLLVPPQPCARLATDRVARPRQARLHSHKRSPLHCLRWHPLRLRRRHEASPRRLLHHRRRHARPRPPLHSRPRPNCRAPPRPRAAQPRAAPRPRARSSRSRRSSRTFPSSPRRRARPSSLRSTLRPSPRRKTRMRRRNRPRSTRAGEGASCSRPSGQASWTCAARARRERRTAGRRR